MRSMEDIRKELGEVQTAYVAMRADEAVPEAQWRPLSTEINVLKKELSDAISEGAEPCEHCERMPVGLRHVHCSLRNGVRTDSYVWEVGCTTCKDHRSVGPGREDAVAAWNASTYLPPKAV